MIDPNTATVADVVAYMDEHPAEAASIRAAEAKGQDRAAIAEWAPPAVADEPATGPSEPTPLPAGAEVVTATPQGQWERLEANGKPVTVEGKPVQVANPKPRTDLAGVAVKP